MTETVTIRLGKGLKRKIKEFKINVSEVARRALVEEVEKREREALLNSLAEAKGILSRLSDSEIVSAVRSSRDER